MRTSKLNLSKSVYSLGVIIVISLYVGFAVAAQQGPSRYISSIKWSPDGASIAVSVATNLDEGCYQNPELYAIRILNSISGDILAELKEDICSVNSIDFSPDGMYLVSSSRTGNISIWNLANYQRVIASQTFTNIQRVEWSPNGENILAIHSAGAEIRAPASLQLVGNASIPSDSQTHNDITDATWSKDSTFIAIGSTNGDVYLWDVATNAIASTLQGHESAVTTVAWNPQANFIATADLDGTILLWDLSSRQISATLLGHAGEIKVLDWNPDGETLVSAGVDGTVRVWNTRDNTLLESIDNLDEAWTVDYSPYGGRLVFGGSTLEQYETHNAFIRDALETIVPDASVERLQSIVDACNAPGAVEQSLTIDVQMNDLTAFAEEIETLPENTIPPACAADLVAVAQALQRQLP